MRQSATDDPVEVGDLALYVAGGLCVATVAECLFCLLYHSLTKRMPNPGTQLTVATPALIALLGVPVFALYARLRSGALVALSSVTLATFVIVNFRGSHRWPGFYDLPDYSRLPYALGWVAAAILGLLVHRALPRSFGQTWLKAATVIALVWTWIDAVRGLPIMTFVPYTRHWAMTVVGLMLAAALIAQQRDWVDPL